MNFLARIAPLSRNGVTSTETEAPKVELIGFEEESTEESVTLRPNRFRPEAGIRNRLRNRLNQVLKDEDLDGDDSNDFLADERTVPRYAQSSNICRKVQNLHKKKV